MYWEYLLINQLPKVAIHRAGPALATLGISNRLNIIDRIVDWLLRECFKE